ncbi:MAG TPA: hypothetical protein VJJ82_01830 [Candidatus Nanoarchaeia archaeon]|nr:hypothetical protein [Candidatus Nanoarchaeia archaeon]
MNFQNAVRVAFPKEEAEVLVKLLSREPVNADVVIVWTGYGKPLVDHAIAFCDVAFAEQVREYLDFHRLF